MAGAAGGSLDGQSRLHQSAELVQQARYAYAAQKSMRRSDASSPGGRRHILGGVVMGLGIGLFEETIYDARNTRPVNSNYADYLVPTNKDIPDIDCILLDYPDPSSMSTAHVASARLYA
jgi:hypothetical protein